MPRRREPLCVGNVYHIFTKSIGGYVIFREKKDYERMLWIIRYYNDTSAGKKFFNLPDVDDTETNERLLDIIAFCVMPTHIHFILKQLKEGGISTYMRKVLDSYAKYFNTKYKRKGPLFEGRFKNVMVEDMEHLYHLTRYIHLNPVSASLVESPEQWQASSFREFINDNYKPRLCNYEDLLEIDPGEYKEFVVSRKGYQKEIELIKHLILE